MSVFHPVSGQTQVLNGRVAMKTSAHFRTAEHCGQVRYDVDTRREFITADEWLVRNDEVFESRGNKFNDSIHNNDGVL